MLTKGVRPKHKTRYSAIGVDIGTRSVQMVQLKNGPEGLILHAAAIKMLQEEEKRSEYLIGILRSLKGEAPFVRRTVVSRMPHAQVTIMPIQIPAGKEEIEAAIVKEAEGYLPYPIEEAVIDYIPMQERLGGDRKVLLVAAPRPDVEAHLNLLKAAGFEPEAVDVGPNALRRLFRFIRSIERRILLINIGRKSTFFTVLWDGDIMIDRQIRWGDAHLVERLSADLKIDFNEALHLLHTFGLKPRNSIPLFPQGVTTVLSEDAIANAIFQITARDLERFAAEAEKVLVYCASENRGNRIDQTYLIGGGPFVRNLSSYLEARLGMAMKMVDPLHPFEGSAPEGCNPALFAVSIGLALKGFCPDGA